MKREEVKAIFPNATDDEIDSILNKIGSELNPLKQQLKTAESERDAAKSALSEAQMSEANVKQQLAVANAKLEDGMTTEEKLAQLEAQAAAREQEFTLKSNGLDARQILVEAGYFDTADIDALVTQVTVADTEATKTAAKLLVDTVAKQRSAVEAATKDALLKNNPSLSGGGNDGGTQVTTVKEFLALPYAEQLALKESNPQILSQLTK